MAQFLLNMSPFFIAIAVLLAYLAYQALKIMENKTEVVWWVWLLAITFALTLVGVNTWLVTTDSPATGCLWLIDGMVVIFVLYALSGLISAVYLAYKGQYSVRDFDREEYHLLPLAGPFIIVAWVASIFCSDDTTVAVIVFDGGNLTAKLSDLKGSEDEESPE